MRSHALRPAFIAASVAWALMLPLAPLVAGRAHTATAFAAFALAVYGVGSVICHQLPERSYRLFGAQMPVCARCTGIYAGAAIAAILAASRRTAEAVRHNQTTAVRHDRTAMRDNRTTVAPGFSPAEITQRRLRLVLLAAAVPTALTLVFEWTTGVTPSNTVRFAAGVPIGAAIAWAVVRHASDSDVARPGAAGG